MDRIIVQSGGMPLRVDDFGFLHDVKKGIIKAILSGLTAAEGCVLSGLSVVEGSQTISVSEGYYYDGNEVFYIPQASFDKEADHFLILTPDNSTGEPRSFYDGVTRDCHAYRRYISGYVSSLPQGSFKLSETARIENIIDNKTQEVISAALSLLPEVSVQYASGFSAATGYQGVQLSRNTIGEVMITAAFDATESSGELFTLPSEFRPSSDLVGYYYSGNTLGLMIIKSGSGEVLVHGADTDNPNYISFTFKTGYTDLVEFSIPTGGGSS
jgi:hypothetical protein